MNQVFTKDQKKNKGDKLLYWNFGKEIDNYGYHTS